MQSALLHGIVLQVTAAGLARFARNGVMAQPSQRLGLLDLGNSQFQFDASPGSRPAFPMKRTQAASAPPALTDLFLLSGVFRPRAAAWFTLRSGFES
jgi:hypothetical protein